MFETDESIFKSDQSTFETGRLEPEPAGYGSEIVRELAVGSPALALDEETARSAPLYRRLLLTVAPPAPAMTPVTFGGHAAASASRARSISAHPGRVERSVNLVKELVIQVLDGDIGRRPRIGHHFSPSLVLVRRRNPLANIRLIISAVRDVRIPQFIKFKLKIPLGSRWRITGSRPAAVGNFLALLAGRRCCSDNGR